MRRLLRAVTTMLVSALFFVFAPAGLALGPPPTPLPAARAAPAQAEAVLAHAPIQVPARLALPLGPPAVEAFAPEGPALDPGQVWPPDPRGPPQASHHTPVAFALHWTAGSHSTTYGYYHWCIRGDGTVVATLSERTRGAHLAGTNTGVVGIAWCAMAGGRMQAGKPWSASAPITPIQIERKACLLAERSLVLGIPLRGEVVLASGLRVPRAAGHGWYAAKGVPGVIAPYPGERWELGGLETTVLPKAEWYRARILSGAQAFTLSRR